MGIRLELVIETVDKDLLCCLCEQLLESPTKSDCGHICCSSCVEKAKEKTTSSICTQCRRRVRNTADQPSVPASLVQKIDSLTVRCTLGCGEILTVKQLRAHTTKECQFRVINCVNRGCCYRCPVKELDEHLLLCDFRLVRCEVCRATVIHRDMPAHQAVKRCYEQQLKRRRVQSARKLSQELREHYADMIQDKHLTEQAERKLVRDHYNSQKTSYAERKRTQSAGPVLIQSIQTRVGSALGVERYSRNISIAAIPVSCWTCESKFLSGRRPSARRHSHSKVRFALVVFVGVVTDSSVLSLYNPSASTLLNTPI